MTPDFNIVVTGEKVISICPDLPPIVLLLEEETVNLFGVLIDEN